MARTGLRYIVVAKLLTAVDNQAPTYDVGMILGAGVAADITYTSNEAKLYANNALRESAKAITGGTISLTLDDIENDARVYALNVKTVEENGKTIYRTTGASSPYVGLGFIEERITAGVTTHIGTWVYKCQFAPQGKSAQTRGENVEFRTTQVNGEMMGIYPDASGDVAFFEEQEFEDGALATAWINSKAGIV